MTLQKDELNDNRERGVSETIGFLLIFTIMIMGIALVTLYGYPVLLEQQVNADEKIMEKNMIVLQNDVKSLTYKTVPYKETSLKIGGGSLTVYNTEYSPPTSTIKIYDLSTTYVDSYHSGDLRYESVSAQTDISLQNGAVVLRKHSQEGSVMLAEPRWFYDNETNTMVINLISINSTELMAKTGIGTVQMSLGGTNYTYKDNINVDVFVEYTPDTGNDYSVAWNNYFTNSMKMTEIMPPPSPPARTYQLPITTNPPATLVIKKFEVIIKSI